MNEQMRERPGDAAFDEMVARAKVAAMSGVASRQRWWRRLSRPTMALGVAGVVAAGGIAYAAVDRPAPEPPETYKGPSVIEIGSPGPGDKWLNISVSYRCEPGESLAVRDDRSTFLSYDCEGESTSSSPGLEGVGGRGVADSIPVDEVHGTRLVVTSDLSNNYLVTATWGPRAQIEMQGTLPEDGPDGEPDWAMPAYEVNEYGLTVGAPTVRTPESAWPDLYPVEFKGEEAYFIKADMVGNIPGTLEEGKRQTAERRRLGLEVNGKSYQFVYAADGKTKLGKKFVGTYE